MSDRFAGKRGLVLGVANRRSIAWAIAQQLADGGAQLAFTYQGERIEKGVRELAESVELPAGHRVRRPLRRGSRARLLGGGRHLRGKLDLLVHSVAFADARDLEGRFTDTPRDRFWLALDVSAYSLVACARLAEPLMDAAGGGSIMTMTYLGGERAVPHYNVMGVAKADARRLRPLPRLGSRAEEHPRQRRLRRPGADARRALDRRLPDHGGDRRGALPAPPPHRLQRRRRRGRIPPLGRGRNITGTTLYVDSGYHAMGM